MAAALFHAALGLKRIPHRLAHFSHFAEKHFLPAKMFHHEKIFADLRS